MATLEKIWVKKAPFDSYELRIVWDNDRHQAVRLDNLKPETVRDALLNAAWLLGKEINEGVI